MNFSVFCLQILLIPNSQNHHILLCIYFYLVSQYDIAVTSEAESVGFDDCSTPKSPFTGIQPPSIWQFFSDFIENEFLLKVNYGSQYFLVFSAYDVGGINI